MDEVRVSGRCLYCGPVLLSGTSVEDATTKHVLSPDHQQLMELDRELDQFSRSDRTDSWERPDGTRVYRCHDCRMGGFTDEPGWINWTDHLASEYHAKSAVPRKGRLY